MQMIKKAIFYALLGCFFVANGQEIQVKTSSQNIKIGEQIEYKISVETSATDRVLFPEGQTFIPMEVVKASPIDTITENDKIRLERNYFVTHFDSGSYVIPRQRIRINTNDFFTDSLRVEVQGIAVDTISKPLFDIKPIQETVITSKSNTWIWVIGVILVILAVSGALYFFIFRKKKLSAEEQRRKLPPFERAIQDLKSLQNSKYLIESKYKEYYSELTNIVREYLEDEVQILAKESTTDELLEKINLLQENGKLNLSQETIFNLKRVLQNADLVKFAKNTPSDNTAEFDRETIEDVVVKTKKAIPQSVDEVNIALSKAIQKAKKRTKRKAFIVTAVVISIYIGTFVFIHNFVNNSFLNFWNESATIKELNEGKWITSDYGYPITELSTPSVLKRMQIIDIQEFSSVIDKQYVFDFGDLNSDFYVMTSVMTFKQQNENQPIDLDPSKVNNIVLSQLEKAGAQNITTLDEEYTAQNGAKGIKVYGTMVMKNSKGEPYNAVYQLYSFTENGALQQLLITHIDTPMGEQITEKIVNSMNFKKE